MYYKGENYDKMYHNEILYDKGFQNSVQIFGNTIPKYRYVRDYLNGNTSNPGNHWVEIQVFSNGENVALNKTVVGQNTPADTGQLVISQI